ncbi:hypothetical protein [Spirosoma sp. KNUC1025]|uniref:hypothetical protein n=1 Tax=Spirosoma sp. KNUC1025 TaxID=2894082 RepID=UPI001E38DE33|nr:hypothetical protein [Spirosoma sp. KNUC1025]UFH57534.1 hypothetical protein LN737_31000 [Spirosoma sp. KNUC1025]
MTFLKICWVINGFTLLLAVFFFLDGLRSATNDDYFSVWAPIFGTLLVGLPISYWLNQNGQSTLATVLASIPDGFAALIGAFFQLMGLVILISFISGKPVRWN